MVEREAHVQALAVGGVDRVAGAGDRVGGQAVAGDVVVDGGVGGEGVDHRASP